MSMLKIFIAIILIAAGCAILFVALPAMGITLPGWATQIFVIVLVAAVACIALIFLFQWWQKLP
jgi:hypothetical protein